MPKAQVIKNFGGPEVLEWGEVEVADPGPGQVRLRQRAVGMNMMEVGLRMGVYPGPPLPFIPGVEAAAEVIALGEGVTDFKVGDRVGYAGPPVGSYAEERNFPESRLFSLPDDVTDVVAAASMVKGITAECLMRLTYEVGPQTKVLIHAAAGATGAMCVQLAKHLGAEVFGTVGSAEKVEFLKSLGCDHVILYRDQNFADAVLDLTDGEGVDLCLDSVGAETFEDSVRCTHILGTVGLFGVASGQPEPVHLMLQDLETARKFVRPSIYAYTKATEQLRALARQTFEDISAGVLKPTIHAQLPLSEAPQLHSIVESRASIGSSVMLCD